MNDYFFCYNNNLARFIKSRGVKQITVARDLVTEKVFTLFEITPEFQSALEEYKYFKLS